MKSAVSVTFRRLDRLGRIGITGVYTDMGTSLTPVFASGYNARSSGPRQKQEG